MSRRPEPRLTVVQSREASGTIAIRKQTHTRLVARRSLACRRFSTTLVATYEITRKNSAETRPHWTRLCQPHGRADADAEGDRDGGEAERCQSGQRPAAEAVAPGGRYRRRAVLDAGG